MENDVVLVCAVVKYDHFPHFNVIQGELRGDGSVRWPGCGVFRGESIIKIFPVGEFEDLRRKQYLLEEDYREGKQKLRVDLLKEHGVDFVTVE